MQPTTLSYEFRKMFDGEWRNVMKCLFREERELLGIRFLSKLLEVRCEFAFSSKGLGIFYVNNFKKWYLLVVCRFATFLQISKFI